MSCRKCFAQGVMLAVVGTFSFAATAEDVLQMDVNGLTANVPGGWDGLTHTGPVHLSMDPNSTLNAVLINGADQLQYNGVLVDFQGVIDLMDGVVVGGNLFVELATGETYSCSIPSGIGDVDMSAGQTGPYTIDGEAMGGDFGSLVGAAFFGNVDVSFWRDREPLSGSFIAFKLSPGATSNMDDDVDIDIFVVAQDVPDMTCKEHEPNDNCDFKNSFTTECEYVQGMLEKRMIPGPQPDTWLCVIDKFGNHLASNDNGSSSGNGKASGVWSDDIDADGWADLLVNNGDGTRSLRLVVTGFPDGLDGNCNGFFQNAPHGQRGEFTVMVHYLDAMGGEIRIDTYVDEFVTGAEAFMINFTAPAGAAEVHVEIDNTTGRETLCFDRDFMCFEGLEPFEAYCITVVSGLDTDCNPIDTVLGWFDKNCDLIFPDDDSGPGGVGYSELCVIADVNGVISIGVSGKGDLDFDGWDDVSGEAHGVCGTYMLQVRRADGSPMLPVVPVDPCAAAVSEAVQQGDLNEDGIVNGVDLANLLANWGLSLHE